ncbi:MAG: STAS domain-containing protein [Thiotrichales bacterium]|nr:STAS domain-containing protein [Thiotrichales bacterium]
MEGSNTVLCEEELGIANAQDFSQTLHDAFLASKTIIVDFSKTQYIDTSIAQLICLFDREAKEKSVDLKWHYSSAVFETMKTLGLNKVVEVERPCSPEEKGDEQA